MSDFLLKRACRALLVAPLVLGAVVTAGAPSTAAASVRSTGQMATVSGMRAGDQIVGGLSARKQQLRAMGVTTRELAVAMLETDNLQANYAWGDGKSGDAANYGIFKQNWGMIRKANPDLARMGQQAAGRKLNSDINADLRALRNSRNLFRESWYAGHRNGSTGLGYPNTQDIANYQSAVQWITDQLIKRPGHRLNDIRYWVEVPAI